MPKKTNKQTQPHEIKVHLRKQEVKSASELILHSLILQRMLIQLIFFIFILYLLNYLLWLNSMRYLILMSKANHNHIKVRD